MLRKQARLRREYVYRKTIEQRERLIQDKKDRLKKALDENSAIPTDLRQDALNVQGHLGWNDVGGEGTQDDEYRWAGVEDPKLVLTTSRDPSSKLKQFAKEMKLVFPNCQRINRGNYEVKQIIDACRANDVTDIVIIHEHRGVPDTLVISHLPYGPTAFFNMSSVIARHDIPNLGHMSEQYPHLIFRDFETKLGRRVQNVLKHLFPVPKADSKRVITFANSDDYISFRHHTFKTAEGETSLMYKIVLGTLENVDSAQVEWVARPYMNTNRKRKFLAE